MNNIFTVRWQMRLKFKRIFYCDDILPKILTPRFRPRSFKSAFYIHPTLTKFPSSQELPHAALHQ
jgi:hypothetical protein